MFKQDSNPYFWSEYANLYPDRYMQSPEFFYFLNEILKTNFPDPTKAKVLDIGGNIEGTLQLKPYAPAYLDPYCAMPPWYSERIMWDDIWQGYKHFDLIVAKNCINYFEKNQIEVIPLILNKGGIFVANTFLKPTTIKRPFINSKVGISGIEYTKFSRNGKIQHFLKIGDKIIEHEFYYYTVNNYEHFFKDYKVEFYNNNKNSLFIKVTK